MSRDRSRTAGWRSRRRPERGLGEGPGAGAGGIVRPGRGLRSAPARPGPEGEAGRVGDTVVTAGWRSQRLASIYPKGLPIGRVTSVGRRIRSVQAGSARAVHRHRLAGGGARPPAAGTWVRLRPCGSPRSFSSPRSCRSRHRRLRVFGATADLLLVTIIAVALLAGRSSAPCRLRRRSARRRGDARHPRGIDRLILSGSGPGGTGRRRVAAAGTRPFLRHRAHGRRRRRRARAPLHARPARSARTTLAGGLPSASSPLLVLPLYRLAAAPRRGRPVRARAPRGARAMSTNAPYGERAPVARFLPPDPASRRPTG